MANISLTLDKLSEILNTDRIFRKRKVELPPVNFEEVEGIFEHLHAMSEMLKRLNELFKPRKGFLAKTPLLLPQKAFKDMKIYEELRSLRLRISLSTSALYALVSSVSK